jgi:benzoyl-CoA reductase/2-hydroxyglutaryl-CoA dehydratase subunit BcrC/BadD/HgdB
MNTYYKNDNGNFIATSISVDDAIAAIVQSAVTNAVNKANDIIINAVITRVSSAVEDSNIKAMVDAHLATASIGDIVDEAVGNAVRDYDYDGVIDNTLDSIDIDEMVTEKVTDHLSECSIQVRIN